MSVTAQSRLSWTVWMQAILSRKSCNALQDLILKSMLTFSLCVTQRQGEPIELMPLELI